MRINGKRGFTLLEIMIVILIIGILMAIAVPQLMHARERSQTNSCISNLKEIETAKEQWAMENGQPPTATPVQANLTPSYIKLWPSCPMSGTYTIGSMETRPDCSEAINGHLLP